MSCKQIASSALHCLRIGVTGLALFQFTIGGPLASSILAGQDEDKNEQHTSSPIKHVIVIIGALLCSRPVALACMTVTAKWLRGTRESGQPSENTATGPYHQKSRPVHPWEEKTRATTRPIVTRVGAGTLKNENTGRKSHVEK